MKFYDLIVKNLKIKGLINSIFLLLNDDNKTGVEFQTNELSKPFIGYDKTSNELVGSNDGTNFFPLYNGDGSPFIIDVISENDALTIDSEFGFPVGLIAPNNAVIPVQKETIKLIEDNYIIELYAYVSYAGLTQSDGTWKVCVVSSGRGAKGEPGESLKLEVGSVVAGVSPNIEIIGQSPKQTINFTLPSFWNNYEIISSSENNTISVSTNSIPVMLKTNEGKFYNIKGSEISLNENKTKFLIDISGALAVNNDSYFDGDWEVYFAGGAKNTSNICFSPSTNGVGELSKENNEIILETYMIEINHLNIYNKSSNNGSFTVTIFVDNIELQSNVLLTSNQIVKNTISFDTPITGNIKITRSFDNELDIDDKINIYKIEG